MPLVETSEPLPSPRHGSPRLRKVGRYKLGHTIGRGAFSKVKYAVDSESGCAYAIKVVDKNLVMRENVEEQLKREIAIMKNLKHPNILELREVFQTGNDIHIVLELVTGGDLSQRIDASQGFDEPSARTYFQQLIPAVQYCHRQGVAHRDLKPDNILFDAENRLKIADFGLSNLQRCNDQNMLKTVCGTPQYVAPEVLKNEGYNGFIADVWSCGVILFVMIANRLPFDDPNVPKLFRIIQSGEYTMPESFSAEVKDLISKILVVDTAARFTLDDIIAHPWFQVGWNPLWQADIPTIPSFLVDSVSETGSTSSGINLMHSDDLLSPKGRGIHSPDHPLRHRSPSSPGPMVAARHHCWPAAQTPNSKSANNSLSQSHSPARVAKSPAHGIAKVSPSRAAYRVDVHQPPAQGLVISNSSPTNDIKKRIPSRSATPTIHYAFPRPSPIARVGHTSQHEPEKGVDMMLEAGILFLQKRDVFADFPAKQELEFAALRDSSSLFPERREHYLRCAKRLTALVCPGELVGLDKPPASVHCFTKEEFPCYAEDLMIRNEHTAIQFVHPPEMCHMHAPIVVLHYVVWHTKRRSSPPNLTPHPSVDLQRLITEQFTPLEIESHIFDRSSHGSLNFLKRILKPGSEVIPASTSVILDYLNEYGPGLVSHFEVYPAFLSENLHRHYGEPKGVPSGAHAMVLVGARRSVDGKQRFLLQNWWAQKQFVEIDENYLEGCGATVYFVRTPQEEVLSGLPARRGHFFEANLLDKGEPW